MDEFGVLVESIGFKAGGKSAPIAHLKSKPKSNFSFSNGFPQNIGTSSTNESNSSQNNDFVADDLDGIFQLKSNNPEYCQRSQNYFDDSDDIFGGSFSNLKPPSSTTQKGIDLDSVFNFNDSSTKSSSNLYDDLLTSTPKRGDAVDDLLGNFGSGSESFKRDVGVNESQFDELIPGFGGNSPSSNWPPSKGTKSEGNLAQPSNGDSSKSNSSSANDPFSVFESSKSTAKTSSWPFSDPLEPHAEQNSVQSSIDELEKFAMGKVQHDASNKRNSTAATNIKIPLRKKDGKASDNASVNNVKTQEELLRQSRGVRNKERAEKFTEEKKETFANDNDLVDVFSFGKPSHVNQTKSRTEDPIFDALFTDKSGSEVKQTPSRTSYNNKKSSSATISFDDFPSLFGDSSPPGEFEEIEGESEERRIARLNHHRKTQERMAKALAEKQQRDRQTQHEQEERHRHSEALDHSIKHWAAGKEGNLRALLSSLQDVLWPECGWQPVSLTDLITSMSVKKIYYKANLCVHPDKVQQKGFSLQQKYIAEKIFDLLKEAWTKFEAEELR